jgi:hypothetical protein
VQDDFADKSLSGRQLTLACGALFANSGQLQRLSIFSLTGHVDSGSFLPRKLMGVISMASALECLTLAIPQQECFRALAASVRSLRNLKVIFTALQQCCGLVAHIRNHSLPQMQLTVLYRPGMFCWCIERSPLT